MVNKMDGERPKTSTPHKSKSNISQRLGRSEKWVPICDSDPRPLVPENEYTAGCTAARRFHHPIYKREVISLELMVLAEPYVGTRLERFYSATHRVGRNSVYLREWTIANGGRPPKRKDRMSLCKFEGKIFLVRVKTVKKAWDGNLHPEGLRYSKVAAILELLATNEGTS